MEKKLAFNSVLVPTDFSPVASEAFDRALALLSGDSPVVILLHVIDPALIEFATQHNFDTEERIVQRMRDHAEGQLAEYTRRAEGRADIDAIVSTGMPFLEILKKAKDFDVDVIVMGKVGASGRFEKLLFGSTAEKVLRASQRPVLILPSDASE